MSESRDGMMSLKIRSISFTSQAAKRGNLQARKKWSVFCRYIGLPGMIAKGSDAGKTDWDCLEKSGFKERIGGWYFDIMAGDPSLSSLLP